MATEWKPGEIIIAIVGSFFLVQIVSILLTNVFGLTLWKGGWVIMLAIFAAAIVGILNIFLQKEVKADSGTIIAIVVLIGVMVAIYFAFPAMVPQIFEKEIIKIQSVLGLEKMSMAQTTLQSMLGW